MTANGEHPYEALSAWLDGESPPAEREQVDEHLRGCGSCRDLLEEMRRVSRAVAEEPVPPVSLGLEGRIRQRLDPAPVREAGVPPARWYLYRLPLAAAAVLAGALALWVAWTDFPGITEPGPITELTLHAPAPEADRRSGPPEPAVAPGGKDEVERLPAKVEAKQKKRQAIPAVREPEEPAPQRPEPPTAREGASEDAEVDRVAGPADGPESGIQARKGRVLKPESRGPGAPAARVQSMRSVAVLEREETGRSLVLAADRYRITLAETGALLLVSEDYQCAVALSGPSEGFSVKEIFAAVQVLAGGEPAAAEPGHENALPLLSLTLSDPGGATRVPAGTGGPGEELATRLLNLVFRDSRRILEERCGPLPPYLGPGATGPDSPAP
jgi:hypothetical protein